MNLRTGVFVAVLWSLCSQSAWASTWVFVSEAGERRIVTFELNLDDGQLKQVSKIDLPGEPGSLCHDVRNRRVFASLRSTGQLASIRLNELTGKLSLINIVDAGADPAYVTIDKSSRYLLSAYYRAGKVSVHRIDEDGMLSTDPLQSIVTDEKAHAVAINRSNQFVWVPHTRPDAVHQFRFNEHGMLTPNQPAVVTTLDETGPRHLAIHPNGRYAYTSNEQGSSVTLWMIDQQTGSLKAEQTLTSLPDSFNGANSCSHIELTPSGDFLYVANRGDDSLALYTIDDATGHLTSNGWTPTEKTPRSFKVDPSGRYLIAAGQSSGKLALYRIDAGTGDLSRYDTIEVGQRPWWVHIVETKSSL